MPEVRTAWTPLALQAAQSLCPQPPKAAKDEGGLGLRLPVALSPTSAGVQQPAAPTHPHTELCPGAAEGLPRGWGHRQGECMQASVVGGHGVMERGLEQPSAVLQGAADQSERRAATSPHPTPACLSQVLKSQTWRMRRDRQLPSPSSTQTQKTQRNHGRSCARGTLPAPAALPTPTCPQAPALHSVCAPGLQPRVSSHHAQPRTPCGRNVPISRNLSSRGRRQGHKQPQAQAPLTLSCLVVLWEGALGCQKSSGHPGRLVLRNEAKARSWLWLVGAHTDPGQPA